MPRIATVRRSKPRPKAPASYPNAALGDRQPRFQAPVPAHRCPTCGNKCDGRTGGKPGPKNGTLGPLLTVMKRYGRGQNKLTATDILAHMAENTAPVPTLGALRIQLATLAKDPKSPVQRVYRGHYVWADDPL